MKGMLFILLGCLIVSLLLFNILIFYFHSVQDPKDYLIPEHTEPEYFSHQFKLMADKINGN